MSGFLGGGIHRAHITLVMCDGREESFVVDETPYSESEVTITSDAGGTDFCFKMTHARIEIT